MASILPQTVIESDGLTSYEREKKNEDEVQRGIKKAWKKFNDVVEKSKEYATEVPDYTVCKIETDVNTVGPLVIRSLTQLITDGKYASSVNIPDKADWETFQPVIGRELLFYGRDGHEYKHIIGLGDIYYAQDVQEGAKKSLLAGLSLALSLGVADYRHRLQCTGNPKNKAAYAGVRCGLVDLQAMCASMWNEMTAYYMQNIIGKSPIYYWQFRRDAVTHVIGNHAMLLLLGQTGCLNQFATSVTGINNMLGPQYAKTFPATVRWFEATVAELISSLSVDDVATPFWTNADISATSWAVALVCGQYASLSEEFVLKLYMLLSGNTEGLFLSILNTHKIPDKMSDTVFGQLETVMKLLFETDPIHVGQTGYGLLYFLLCQIDISRKNATTTVSFTFSSVQYTLGVSAVAFALTKHLRALPRRKMDTNSYVRAKDDWLISTSSRYGSDSVCRPTFTFTSETHGRDDEADRDALNMLRSLVMAYFNAYPLEHDEKIDFVTGLNPVLLLHPTMHFSAFYVYAAKVSEYGMQDVYDPATTPDTTNRGINGYVHMQYQKTILQSTIKLIGKDKIDILLTTAEPPIDKPIEDEEMNDDNGRGDSDIGRGDNDNMSTTSTISSIDSYELWQTAEWVPRMAAAKQRHDNNDDDDEGEYGLIEDPAQYERVQDIAVEPVVYDPNAEGEWAKAVEAYKWDNAKMQASLAFHRDGTLAQEDVPTEKIHMDDDDRQVALYFYMLLSGAVDPDPQIEKHSDGVVQTFQELFQKCNDEISQETVKNVVGTIQKTIGRDEVVMYCRSQRKMYTKVARMIDASMQSIMQTISIAPKFDGRVIAQYTDTVPTNGRKTPPLWRTLVDPLKTGSSQAMHADWSCKVFCYMTKVIGTAMFLTSQLEEFIYATLCGRFDVVVNHKINGDAMRIINDAAHRMVDVAIHALYSAYIPAGDYISNPVWELTRQLFDALSYNLRLPTNDKNPTPNNLHFGAESSASRSMRTLLCAICLFQHVQRYTSHNTWAYASTLEREFEEPLLLFNAMDVIFGTDGNNEYNRRITTRNVPCLDLLRMTITRPNWTGHVDQKCIVVADKQAATMLDEIRTKYSIVPGAAWWYANIDVVSQIRETYTTLGYEGHFWKWKDGLVIQPWDNFSVAKLPTDVDHSRLLRSAGKILLNDMYKCPFTYMASKQGETHPKMKSRLTKEMREVETYKPSNCKPKGSGYTPDFIPDIRYHDPETRTDDTASTSLLKSRHYQDNNLKKVQLDIAKRIKKDVVHTVGVSAKSVDKKQTRAELKQIVENSINEIQQTVFNDFKQTKPQTNGKDISDVQLTSLVVGATTASLESRRLRDEIAKYAEDARTVWGQYTEEVDQMYADQDDAMADAAAQREEPGVDESMRVQAAELMIPQQAGQVVTQPQQPPPPQQLTVEQHTELVARQHAAETPERQAHLAASVDEHMTDRKNVRVELNSDKPADRPIQRTQAAQRVQNPSEVTSVKVKKYVIDNAKKRKISHSVARTGKLLDDILDGIEKFVNAIHSHYTTNSDTSHTRMSVHKNSLSAEIDTLADLETEIAGYDERVRGSTRIIGIKGRILRIKDLAKQELQRIEKMLNLPIHHEPQTPAVQQAASSAQDRQIALNYATSFFKLIDEIKLFRNTLDMDAGADDRDKWLGQITNYQLQLEQQSAELHNVSRYIDKGVVENYNESIKSHSETLTREKESLEAIDGENKTGPALLAQIKLHEQGLTEAVDTLRELVNEGDLPDEVYGEDALDKRMDTIENANRVALATVTTVDEFYTPTYTYTTAKWKKMFKDALKNIRDIAGTREPLYESAKEYITDAQDKLARKLQDAQEAEQLEQFKQEARKEAAKKAQEEEEEVRRAAEQMQTPQNGPAEALATLNADYEVFRENANGYLKTLQLDGLKEHAHGFKERYVELIDDSDAPQMKSIVEDRVRHIDAFVEELEEHCIHQTVLQNMTVDIEVIKAVTNGLYTLLQCAASVYTDETLSNLDSRMKQLVAPAAGLIGKIAKYDESIRDAVAMPYIGVLETVFTTLLAEQEQAAALIEQIFSVAETNVEEQKQSREPQTTEQTYAKVDRDDEAVSGPMYRQMYQDIIDEMAIIHKEFTETSELLENIDLSQVRADTMDELRITVISDYRKVEKNRSILDDREIPRLFNTGDWRGIIDGKMKEAGQLSDDIGELYASISMTIFRAQVTAKELAEKQRQQEVENENAQREKEIQERREAIQRHQDEQDALFVNMMNEQRAKNAARRQKEQQQQPETPQVQQQTSPMQPVTPLVPQQVQPVQQQPQVQQQQAVTPQQTSPVQPVTPLVPQQVQQQQQQPVQASQQQPVPPQVRQQQSVPPKPDIRKGIDRQKVRVGGLVQGKSAKEIAKDKRKGMKKRGEAQRAANLDKRRFAIRQMQTDSTTDQSIAQVEANVNTLRDTANYYDTIVTPGLEHQTLERILSDLPDGFKKVDETLVQIGQIEKKQSSSLSQELSVELNGIRQLLEHIEEEAKVLIQIPMSEPQDQPQDQPQEQPQDQPQEQPGSSGSRGEMGSDASADNHDNPSNGNDRGMEGSDQESVNSTTNQSDKSNMSKNGLSECDIGTVQTDAVMDQLAKNVQATISQVKLTSIQCEELTNMLNDGQISKGDNIFSFDTPQELSLFLTLFSRAYSLVNVEQYFTVGGLGNKYHPTYHLLANFVFARLYVNKMTAEHPVAAMSEVRTSWINEITSILTSSPWFWALMTTTGVINTFITHCMETVEAKHAYAYRVDEIADIIPNLEWGTGSKQLTESIYRSVQERVADEYGTRMATCAYHIARIYTACNGGATIWEEMRLIEHFSNMRQDMTITIPTGDVQRAIAFLQYLLLSAKTDDADICMAIGPVFGPILARGTSPSNVYYLIVLLITFLSKQNLRVIDTKATTELLVDNYYDITKFANFKELFNAPLSPADYINGRRWADQLRKLTSEFIGQPSQVRVADMTQYYERRVPVGWNGEHYTLYAAQTPISADEQVHGESIFNGVCTGLQPEDVRKARPVEWINQQLGLNYNNAQAWLWDRHVGAAKNARTIYTRAIGAAGQASSSILHKDNLFFPLFLNWALDVAYEADQCALIATHEHYTNLDHSKVHNDLITRGYVDFQTMFLKKSKEICAQLFRLSYSTYFHKILNIEFVGVQTNLHEDEVQIEYMAEFMLHIGHGVEIPDEFAIYTYFMGWNVSTFEAANGYTPPGFLTSDSAPYQDLIRFQGRGTKTECIIVNQSKNWKTSTDELKRKKSKGKSQTGQQKTPSQVPPDGFAGSSTPGNNTGFPGNASGGYTAAGGGGPQSTPGETHDIPMNDTQPDTNPTEGDVEMENPPGPDPSNTSANTSTDTPVNKSKSPNTQTNNINNDKMDERSDADDDDADNDAYSDTSTDDGNNASSAAHDKAHREFVDSNALNPGDVGYFGDDDAKTNASSRLRSGKFLPHTSHAITKQTQKVLQGYVSSINAATEHRRQLNVDPRSRLLHRGGNSVQYLQMLRNRYNSGSVILSMVDAIFLTDSMLRRFDENSEQVFRFHAVKPCSSYGVQYLQYLWLRMAEGKSCANRMMQTYVNAVLDHHILKEDCAKSRKQDKNLYQKLDKDLNEGKHAPFHHDTFDKLIHDLVHCYCTTSKQKKALKRIAATDAAHILADKQSKQDKLLVKNLTAAANTQVWSIGAPSDVAKARSIDKKVAVEANRFANAITDGEKGYIRIDPKKLTDDNSHALCPPYLPPVTALRELRDPNKNHLHQGEKTIVPSLSTVYTVVSATENWHHIPLGLNDLYGPFVFATALTQGGFNSIVSQMYNHLKVPPNDYDPLTLVNDMLNAKKNTPKPIFYGRPTQLSPQSALTRFAIEFLTEENAKSMNDKFKITKVDNRPGFADTIIPYVMMISPFKGVTFVPLWVVDFVRGLSDGVYQSYASNDNWENVTQLAFFEPLFHRASLIQAGGYAYEPLLQKYYKVCKSIGSSAAGGLRLSQIMTKEAADMQKYQEAGANVPIVDISGNADEKEIYDKMHDVISKHRSQAQGRSKEEFKKEKIRQQEEHGNRKDGAKDDNPKLGLDTSNVQFAKVDPADGS